MLVLSSLRKVSGCRWNSTWLLGFITSFLLLGCSLEPRYQASYPDSPGWKAPQSEEVECVEDLDFDNWWELFNDERLNELEKIARINNKDIFAAIQRVYEARAMAGITGADLYPQISLQPVYSNAYQLISLSATNSVITGIPGIPAFTLPQDTRTHIELFQITGNLNWELDFFGRLKSREDSAIRNLQAQQMAMKGVLLTVASDLAVNYFQLRAQDALLKLLTETIRVRKEAFEVNTDRYEKGFINFSDVTRAETLYYNAQRDYFDTQAQRSLKENMIAVLIGVSPSMLKLEYLPLENNPPRVPAGIPLDVLINRPDIAQMERKAASEHALIGEAYANFFPKVTLTGALGYSSPDFKHFLTFLSRYWTYGVNIFETLLDGYRNEFNLDLSYARFYEASAIYQQTILIAFREVEDALSSIEFQDKEIISLRKAVESSSLTTIISKDRYDRGLVNYLDVSDSERTELETKSSLINLLGSQYVSTIRLIQALGGSWDSNSLPKN